MDLKVKLRDQYPNPPIFEVAWEVVLENHDQFKSELRGKFYKKINELYPSKEVINLATFGFSFGAKNINQSFKPHEEAGMQFFKNDSRNNLVKFWIDEMTKTVRLSILTRVHNNFAEFFGVIKTNLSIFNSVFSEILPETDIVRVGLRYINICDLPDNDHARLAEYFTIPLNNKIHEESLGKINKFQIALEEEYTDQKLIENKKEIGMLKTVFLRSIYRSLQHNNVPKMAMDYDSFIGEKNKFSLENLLINTRILHKLIKCRFIDNITSKFEEEILLKESE